MDFFDSAVQYLSPRVKKAAMSLEAETAQKVCEIRLRLDLPLSFSTYTGALFVNNEGKPCRIDKSVITCTEDIKYTLNRLCQGSVYRYADTIKNGYIVTPEGIRAGICGQAVYEGGSLGVIDNYTAVNLRIPRSMDVLCAPIIRQINQNGLCSMLVFSPPGVGKTTLIRALALQLSLKYRVALIDEKGEILPPCMIKGGGMCDILRGYNKPRGMEIAIRTLSPEVIICDEIGMNDDIPSILSVQNSGVSLIATAHAHNISGLMAKPNIRMLCEAGVFERFVRLEKGSDGMKIIFDTR